MNPSHWANIYVILKKHFKYVTKKKLDLVVDDIIHYFGQWLYK